MSDEYEVGYKKPPLSTRFKKGVCPNPKGRGKHHSFPAGKLFDNVINSSTVIDDGGRSKSAPRMTVTVRRLASAAVKGDIRSADLLLSILNYSEKHGDFKFEIIYKSL
jgi:uncharacterized protein DUF5681